MDGDRPVSVSLQEWLRPGETTMLVLSDVVRATVLLYDTRSMSYMECIRAHRERAKKLIESLGGRVIDTAGDGIFAAFYRAGDAFRYARSIIEDTGNEKLRVRVGVHDGVVHASTDGLFGRAVHYAARLAERGGDSELWASEAAKLALEADAPGLAVQLPWRRFDDCELEGIPGRHTLWCLAKEPGAAPARAQD